MSNRATISYGKSGDGKTIEEIHFYDDLSTDLVHIEITIGAVVFNASIHSETWLSLERDVRERLAP